MQDNSSRLVPIHDVPDDLPEDQSKAFIRDAIPKRDIDRVPLPLLDPAVLDVTRAREEVPVLVETGCEDSVCAVERLLYAVAMMNVDVDVKNAQVALEQLQNRKDDIIDVAESGGLTLLGVMQSTSPVDRDV